MTDDDKNNITEVLLVKSLEGEDLSPAEAERVARQSRERGQMLQRFEAMEADIAEVIADHKKAKMVIKWIVGLLVVNYGATFRDTLETLLFNVVD